VPIRAVAFDVGGVLTQAGHLHDVRERWQERLRMTAADFSKALASVDPDELAFTGLLTETQYKARLAAALGQPVAQADEFMADMCGELDAELVAYVASLRPRSRPGQARPEGLPTAVRQACRLARRAGLP
jgi:hypothetical protein